MSALKINIPVTAAGSVSEDTKHLIAVGDLAARLAGGEKLILIDLRSAPEHAMLRLEGAQLATRELVEEIFGSWAKDTAIVVYDHLGKEALNAVRALESRGFTNSKALAGGIDAWSQAVDPLMPRY